MTSGATPPCEAMSRWCPRLHTAPAASRCTSGTPLSSATSNGTAPASAGYASTGGSATQGSYYPASAGQSGGSYAAADYAQYSNYYYSPQTATYQ